MMQKTNVNILIAAETQSLPAAIEALSSHYELEFLYSMADATTQSCRQIDVIVCGLYFDESRMFDLLRYAKINPEMRDIPFICVNFVEGLLSQTLKQSVEISCRALGANAFVDLYQWKSQHGTQKAYEEFRKLVRQYADSEH